MQLSLNVHNSDMENCTKKLQNKPKNIQFKKKKINDDLNDK